MKTKSFLLSTLFVAVMVVLTQCSGGKKDDSSATHDGHTHASDTTGAAVASDKPQFEVDAVFQAQLSAVFKAYIELKDAFVASDASKVKEKAKFASTALGKVDMTLLSGVAHNDWMTYLTPLQSSLKEIEGTADIEIQRKSFSTASDNLYKSIKAFGLGGQEAYYEFCPMAFNNAGGYWLSDQQQIRNPYFGDKMLTCGVVKEKLQ